MRMAGKHRPQGKSSSSVAGPVSGLVYAVVGLALALVATPVAVIVYGLVNHD